MKRSARSDARYCAAQAIVAVKLGLPLVSVDLRKGTQQRDGYTIVKSASADLAPGTAQGFQNALPDPAARQGLTAMATMAAAASLAEGVEGRIPGDVGQQDAVRQIRAIAETLNVDLASWIAERVSEAHRLLDDAVWDRVRLTLERKRCLSGDEVRALVNHQQAYTHSP